jgi:hypothetical protein
VTLFGYTMMCEQAGPKQLVRDVALAEEAGFDFAVISDHYFPWLDVQGHAPYAWSVLGAAAQTTDHIPLMTYLNGRRFEKLASFEPAAWSAATDRADVRIAGNRFSGDLHRYRITASVEEIEVDVTLVGQIPPWRPGTGYLLYGPKRDLEFAWLPAVPQGTVTASYRIGEETHATAGVGYHDHNWGNVGLMEIINDWYWARGQAGPYSVIAASITGHKKYDYPALTVFMLAKNGKVVADDGMRTRFETHDYYVDPLTRKPVANIVRYRYEGDGETYVVTFTRHSDLTRTKLIDSVRGFKKLAAELVRFDGAYLRFAGELRVQRLADDRVLEEFTDEAIWELMYFGHARGEAGPEVASR